ncbi:MAG TPA: Smr/MutS family protein [Pyrinomonadaceae bacterium]|nr:Smr/MutS family protein [Pyrinomonadaceae bacterium]
MKFVDWIKSLLRTGSANSSQLRDNDTDVDPYNPFPEPVNVEITDVIDLHTIPPQDVKPVVEEYLLEARRLGFRSVRIIHGKGIGVQREIVRTVLAKTPFVDDWTDAPPDAGGLGATIVHLKQAGNRPSQPRGNQR